MDDSAARLINEGPDREPKQTIALGWQEFFERLGQGTLIPQQREAAAS